MRIMIKLFLQQISLKTADALPRLYGSKQLIEMLVKTLEFTTRLRTATMGMVISPLACAVERSAPRGSMFNCKF